MVESDIGWPEEQYVTVEDRGHTMVIDGDGGYASPGASIDTTMAILLELDASSAIVHRMEQTRALDGMQEGSWDEFTATWTYHPDQGLDIIIEEEG